MLAQEGKREDIKRPTMKEQRKYDGTRIIIVKQGDKISIMGARNWVNDYASNFPEIVAEIKKLPVDNCVLDGELTYFKKDTNKDVFLTALAKPENKKGLEAKAMLFDVLWVDDDNLQHLPFADRDEILKTLVPPNLKLVQTVKTVSKDKEKYFEQLKAQQGEGVVLKEVESPYRQGERTPEWLKIKHWNSAEVIVVGWTPGKGVRASTFGSLILAQRDKKGKLHYVGKTSGMKNSELQSILAKMKKLHVSKSPLVDVPANVKVAGWVDPKMVIEVKYYERTPGGILRFPDFLRERLDKKTSECRLPS
jgi:bifunctional non-homologous end joining protein LigD